MGITFPYNLTNGATCDAAEVMANFNAIAAYLDTTKLATTSMQRPYVEKTVAWSPGQLAGGSTAYFRFYNPSEELTLLSVDVCVDAKTGAPVLAVDVQDNGSDKLASPLAWNAGTLGTVYSSSNWNVPATIAGARTVTVKVVNSAAGGNSPDQWSLALHFKKLLKT